MIKSMTGFGSFEVETVRHGKVSVEIRSTNHKFLETSLHLPEGSLSLEEKIKKTIEKRVKRGRLNCVVNLADRRSGTAFINKPLLKKYIKKVNSIRKEFNLKEGLNINELIRLPGVLTFEEERISPEHLWPKLHAALSSAMDELVSARGKEGAALQKFLKELAAELKAAILNINKILKGAIRLKLREFSTDEERAIFLKGTDTQEEIDRLNFHIDNFRAKVTSGGAIGKELDFIAQEMQREANTLGAKTFDVRVSSQVLRMKSLIEKIREQVQNIE